MQTRRATRNDEIVKYSENNARWANGRRGHLFREERGTCMRRTFVRGQ